MCVSATDIVVYFAKSVGLQLKVCDGQNVTASELFEYVMEEQNYPPEARQLFSLWLVSDLLGQCVCVCVCLCVCVHVHMCVCRHVYIHCQTIGLSLLNIFAHSKLFGCQAARVSINICICMCRSEVSRV